MELYEVMRSTFACREFTGEPIPEDVLHRIIDNARFAPSGGNRQGWRIINVTDAVRKQRLAELSLPTATRYLLQVAAGESPLNTIHPSAVTEEQVAQAEAPEWLVAHIRNAPTLLVITVDLSLIASMDKDLDRIGLVSGGSIYPLAWNILLAARNEGYGGTMTTWGVAEEPEVKALLDIPEAWAVAAIMPLGKPQKQLTRLKRKPVEEILVTNSWNGSEN
ncbi:MAG: nitroreductase family protein [Pseudomonadales bacterium]|nr:nitroreductase family protein [Pseudomonadales bacterium]MCP5167696.1 nitroreductase family protein [Pseudomonadales bacterium]MCP5187482.1 nitroreductase family protein [Pseudomonadales bacterium]